MVISSAGNIIGAKHVAHVVINNDIPLNDQLFAALQRIDALADVSTVKIPFPGNNTPDSQLWTTAGLVAKAVECFDTTVTSTRGSIRDIVCTNLSLSTADVLSIVLRQAFQVTDQQPAVADDNSLQVDVDSVPNVTETVASQQPNQDEWYTIEGILKQRNYKNKMQYLVKWEGYDATQWCDRANVTGYAIQRFLADEKRKKRRTRK